MKRLLIMVTILGILVGSGGAGKAGGVPARDGRTVEDDYEAPWIPWAGNCVLSHASPCISIPTHGGEALLTGKVTDAHGQPVLVSVWGDNKLYGDFCGETTEPIAFDPGVVLMFSVGSGSDEALPLVDCLPGLATTGTLTVTLYGSPPADAESPTPQPAPTTQPENVERSVHLALRRHLRSEGTVSSDDASCRSGAPVVIQRKRSGDWVDIGSTTTDSDGAFALKLRDRAGRYRAVAPEISSSERTCFAATSPTARHRH